MIASIVDNKIDRKGGLLCYHWKKPKGLKIILKPFY